MARLPSYIARIEGQRRPVYEAWVNSGPRGAPRPISRPTASSARPARATMCAASLSVGTLTMNASKPIHGRSADAATRGDVGDARAAGHEHSRVG